MPVAPHFSQQVYEQLGHQTVDELLECFHTMDRDYRQNLRELNDLNWVRFEARLDQRFAVSDGLRAREFAELETRMERRLTAMEAALERRLGDQARWIAVTWVSMLVGFGALLLALAKR